MINIIKLQIWAFQVSSIDEHTGDQETDNFVLTDNQLRAASVVGMSNDELIRRLYHTQGYTVLSISEPVGRTIGVELEVASLEKYGEFVPCYTVEGYAEIKPGEETQE